MISIKSLFLYLLIFNTITVFAAKKTTEIVQQMCDKVDTDLLEINKHHYGKPLIGTMVSYYKTIFLPHEKAKEEIKKIESYLPTNAYNNKTILKKLIEKHWYVYYVIQKLVEKKIENFEHVTGSTIDKLLYPNFNNDVTGRKEIIHKKAYHQFFINNGITGIALKIPENYDAVTQFILLYGENSPIDYTSIMKSSDEKYLKAHDHDKNILTWCTQNGNRIQLSNQENSTLQWQQTDYTPRTGPFPLCWISQQLAIHHDLTLMNLYRFPIKIDTQKPALLLYKHPTPHEYLVKKALIESNFAVEELNVLLGSKSFTGIKDGFPKDKLQDRIKDQIIFLGSYPKITGTQ